MKNTSEEQSLTEQLSAFLVATQPADIPDPVIDAAKYYILDWLGSAIAGTATEPGRILLGYAASKAGRGATVMGLDEQRNADLAALVNGSLSHIVEMDDLDRVSVVHPAAPIIPAALAVAERERRSGLDFITAVVLGYEVGIRVGEAVGKSHYYFWHNTATCGVFGATAAAGHVLGLSQEQMVWALGNAGTQASGLWEFITDGAMSKHLHAGRAASSGVLAADLAKRGLTGARRILEGERGFFAATSKDAKPNSVIEGLTKGPKEYKIRGVSIKPHASCRHTHPAIDAALALRTHSGFQAREIDSVRIETYRAAFDLTNDPNPTRPYSAKFSLQYCVGSALWREHVKLQDFTPQAIRDQKVRQLMARTTVDFAPELEDRYPRQWPARVTVTLTDGRVLSEEVDHPKGDPENPLTRAELEEKFKQLVAGTGYQGRATTLIQRVNQLEYLEKAHQLLATQL
ncbi:MAG: MmgE/PrpD family protein [Anaerolineae bacterium]